MTSAAGTPAQAIADGRARIAARDCHGAVAVMQDAVPAAATLADPKESSGALAAIHFYSALAFHDCGLAEQAKIEMREFFRFRSGTSRLDPAKYAATFIDLFEDIQRQAKQSATAHSAFERFYGDLNPYAKPAQRTRSIALWGSSSEFQILATNDEREAWGRARDDDARARYVAEFWQRRDREPQTSQNEYREEILRRIDVADHVFLTADEERGSMSDRGRVFVLLGPPSRIHRQALRRFETTIVNPRGRAPITGTLERWVYFRPQVAVPAQQVEFRFITEPGYGEFVMQRDFWPLKALAGAREVRRNSEPPDPAR